MKFQILPILGLMLLAAGEASAKQYGCSVEVPVCPAGRVCDLEMGFCTLVPGSDFNKHTTDVNKNRGTSDKVAKEIK